MRIKPRSFYLVFIGFICFSIQSSGQATYTSTGVTTGWNVTTTWTASGPADVPPDGIPDGNDFVIIANGHTVDVDANSASLDLTINGSGILNYPANNTLTVNGNLTMNGTSQVTGNNNNRRLDINGNFIVPASQTATVGGIRFTVNGTTSISGYFQFAVSGVGQKNFNNTITVNAGGTWDNIVGEDPRINCSIVNNGSWPAPTGGNAVYRVNSAGVYTYSGSQPIRFDELRFTSNSSVTNLGTLVLSRIGGNVLDVQAGASFTNGNGVSAALLQINGTGSITGPGPIDFTPANNTVDYVYAGAQAIYSPTTNYYKLSCSTSGTKTMSGTVTVSNEVNLSGTAILDVNTRTLDGAANLVMTGTSELILGKVSTTLPELTGTANSLASGTTITFNGAGTQTAKSSSATNPSTTNSYPYQNINVSGNNVASDLVFSNVALVNGNLVFTNQGKISSNPVLVVLGTFNFGTSATTLLANNITVGNIIFSAGTLNYSNRTITVNGNSGTWTNNGGVTFINTLSTVIFTTGTNQQISGTTNTTFVNLTINNGNGVTLNGVSTQATSTLTFTLGNITTGTNSIYVPTGGTITRTSGHVVGNLQRDISAGSPSITFQVGTGTDYTPVDLTFNTVTTPGILTVSSTSGDHPDINASNIEPNKSVNRYWSLTNNGIVFTSYGSTFNFVAGDVDGLANTANFEVKRLNVLNWFSTTPGTRTATSTQFTGEASANLPTTFKQEFQIGELIPTTGVFNRVTGAVNWSAQTTWIQNRTGTVTLTNGNPTITGTGTAFNTELSVGDVIMLQTSPGTTYTVLGAPVPTATSINVSPTPAVSTSGGYGRQYVPNAIGDVVTIGNSNIANATTTVNFNMGSPTLINSLSLNTATTPLSTAQNLTHSVANLLTVQTNVTVNQPGGNVTDSWNINAGSATVNGNLIIGTQDNTNTRIAQVVTTTGTLTTGNLIFNTNSSASNELTAVLDMSGGAGRLNLNGLLSFTNNRGRLIPGASSTFNYQRSASGQRVFGPTSNATTTAWTYRHLLLNNTSTTGAFLQAGDVIVNTSTVAGINVLGNIRIQTGKFVTSDNGTITGAAGTTFQIDPGATFAMTGANSTFPTVFGTFSLGTTSPFGTASYGQTNAVTIASPATNFGNLVIVNTNGGASLNATLPGSLTITGNLTVGDGTVNPTLRGNSTTTMTVVGNVTINSNATMDANTNGRIRTFNIGGNWVNNGTFTTSTNDSDNIVFTGNGPTQPQTIGGTATDIFRNVNINTAATTNTVQLLKSISMTNNATGAGGTLTLTQGGIDLNGKILSILRRVPNAIVRTGGYIKSGNTSAPYGTVEWFAGGVGAVSLVYPFGKSSTEYIPVTLNFTNDGVPNNASPSMSISTYATVPANTPFPSTVTNLNGTSGGNSVVDRFWVITDNNYTTKPTITITFTAVGGNGATPPSERPGSIADLSTVAASPAGIAAQRWSPASFWQTATAGQTFANNSPAANFFQVTAPGINSFSDAWALADISAPLPIELIEFKAIAKSEEVELTWKTASELNNDLFVIERSAFGENFIQINSTPGAGTKTTSTNYSISDLNPLTGRSYYRLKQIDNNGLFTYSPIASVEMQGQLWSIYPNPSTGDVVYIKLRGYPGVDVFVGISDLSGKMISSEILSIDPSGIVIVENAQRLATGVYIVTVGNGSQLKRQKLIVK